MCMMRQHMRLNMSLPRTLLCAVLVIFAGANAGAAARQADDPVIVDLWNCSVEGGRATIYFEEREPVLWNLAVYGSHRRIEASVTRRDISIQGVHVTHTYRDESQISYQLDVREDAGRWVGHSMIGIDFSDTIASDLSMLRYLYEGTVLAASEGEAEFSCTSGG